MTAETPNHPLTPENVPRSADVPPMHTLIFSDVHVNVAEDFRPVRECLIRFLRAVDREALRRVIILGDLFDFWFEYRQVIFSGYFYTLRPLADMADAGAEMHFVCGNHDFWAGRFLRDELGFHVHDEVMLPFGDKQALFIHGDGLRPSDWRYRVYKRIARNPVVVNAFRLIHPDWAMGLAQATARGSRYLFSDKTLHEGSEVEPLEKHARDALAQGRADIVFHGHSHYPVIKYLPAPNGQGLYINSGDWLNFQSYVSWDGQDFAMRYFTAPEQREDMPRERGVR